MARMLSLFLVLSLVLVVVTSLTHAGQVAIQWDYDGPRQVAFVLQGCVVDEQGQCVMQDVQHLPGGRLKAKVQVPRQGRMKCFQVMAIKNGQRSEPSAWLCLTD
jgi:hypothetical protein